MIYKWWCKNEDEGGEMCDACVGMNFVHNSIGAKFTQQLIMLIYSFT
jgi:hypothetical protein